ncbi:precorrin-8X methylmutase [Fundidesulfovibrio terrae]|uniref:precorrin-8X methylmutase n=1 Tax=Fundidesulfovibrio terrae TaxID=2922866 RepID=UPI001FB019EC|nr:precorrin-8X methylmutase [Fundidesulfovibrio terrae]
MNTVTLSETVDPAGIERKSFAIIDSEVPEPRPFTGGEWEVVRRLIHTSADFDMLDIVRFSPGSVHAGINALRSGAVIVTDTRMCQAGIPSHRLDALGCRTACWMGDPELAARARDLGVTRARLAMEEAARCEGPLVFAIGNAPTALLRLLELIDEGKVRPELVVGMPVGFVNAAESKALLMERADTPYICISGRKGGSPLAAACVNALAEMALRAGS